MHYILRQGELTLKGKNRGFFENMLADNARYLCNCKTQKAYGRLYIETDEKVDFRKLFGIVSYSPAVKTERDCEAIEKEILAAAKLGKKDKFRITAQRLDKNYPMTSMELAKKLGAAVEKKTGAGVDLENFDLDIGVEVSRTNAFVFTQTIKCFGGLPVGTEGVVAAWLEDNDSLLAALQAMKRGCEIIPFASNVIDIGLLKKFGCRKELQIKDVADIEDGKALVVGDRLQNYKSYTGMPVLRPLIAYTDEMVKEELKKYESVP